MKESRKVVNFFSKYPQREDKLDHVREAMDMPNISLQNYSGTRVGYVVITLQSLMENHGLLSVSLHDGSNEDFEKVCEKLLLLTTNVASIQEMEAVTKLLFAYAVDESQYSNALNRSLILPWHRTAMIAATNKNIYEVMISTRQAPVIKLNN